MAMAGRTRTSAMAPTRIPKTTARATSNSGRTTLSWTDATTSSMVAAALAGHSACETPGVPSGAAVPDVALPWPGLPWGGD